jgi:SET domain-containing protein
MPTRHPLDHPLVMFKPSRIHGIGGFAWVDLRKGQRIIEYIGPKISKAKGLAELEKGNAYIFSFDENYDIDGSVMWNPARFLNHSCAPNCESDIVRDQIWLYAKRRIKAGEELTYNYGHGLAGYEECPCNCGASTCVGFMVDEQYFATVRRRHGKSR